MWLGSEKEEENTYIISLNTTTLFFTYINAKFYQYYSQGRSILLYFANLHCLVNSQSFQLGHKT